MHFAGVSGSTSADDASIGGMMISSIIPPSILMVLYSSMIGISVGKLFMGIFVYKEFTFQGAIKTIISAARTSGMTMLIVASTTAFGYCLAIEKFPARVSALLTGIAANPNVLMLLMIIAMSIIGMFMDTTSAAIIMVPIFYPIAEACGINGIHFGMVMVRTFNLGGITPPAGVTLFIATAVAKIPFVKLLKEMWPFILLFVIVLFMVAYIPGICLFVPNLIG